MKTPTASEIRAAILILESLVDRVDNLTDEVDDLSSRLRSLEDWKDS
jgi:hypothetical protein